MVKTVTLRKCAFSALTALGFASGAWAVDGYTVKCVHYYQDSAVMLNSSQKFVAEVGLLGGFTKGQQAVLTCDPKAIPTLQHSAGYYVTGWDLDADWGDNLPISGVFTPTHLKQFGAVNPLAITFSSASLGFGPRTCELVPHISMMHYKLAYDKNASDATGTAPSVADHYYSESVTAAASVFARTGYTPKGWNTAINGSGIAVAFNQNVTGATFPVTNHNQVVTLYAQWQVNQYTLRLTIGTGIDKIYYKVNGATSWTSTNVSRDVPVAFGTTWYAYAVAKSGYTYTASSAEKPISDTMTIEGANFAPIASANKIRVAYDGNGKTSGSMSATDFTYNESRKLADVSYSRSYTVTYNSNYAGGSVSSDHANYEFVGWNNAADGTGAYSYADGAEVTNPCGSTGGNITLFAQWRPVAVTLLNPVRTGYDFLGWYSDRTGTNAVGRADELYVPTQSITVYAKWKVRSYTVTFVDKTGEQTIRTESVSYGDSATAPIAPTRPGESFSTWNTDDYRKVTEDLVVKAKYDTVKYHVTYHSNYQDPKMSDRSVLSVGCGPLAEYSDRITLLDVGSSDLGFSKKGYRFLGWSWMSDATENDFKAGATVAWNQIAERLEVVGSATQSADLYAVWVPITYTIRFEPGIATGETTEQLMIYDRPARLQKNPYTLDHQNLLFWDRGAETFFDQQLVTNLTTTADEILVLTATWDGNGDHTVMFNGNGATNCWEYAQGFVGSTAQHLTSNRFERTGCEFKGWMTNDIISTSVTNWSSVLYHDRDLYQFLESAPRYSTNTLYAAWDPIEYTLLFNTGTNGVTGTMQPLVFYGTNTEVTFIYEYSEINGQGLKGWTRTQGSQEVEYGLTRKIDTKRTAINGISNLVDSVGNGVTLYAVWEGIGDLSVAAGLTNAVLKSDSWTVGSEADTNYVGVTKTEPSTYEMSAKVIGPGRFIFDWYWDVDSDDSTFKLEVRTNSTVSVDKKTIHVGGTGEWQTYKDYDVTVTGECTVAWQCTPTKGCKENDLRVKNVRWTPRDQEKVVWPTYTLTYTNTMGAAMPASLPKTYAVTNETFTFAPLVDVEGYEFIGWSPAKIVKNTTGDITVKAKWRKVVTTHNVKFELAGAIRIGGGELEQKVEHGYDAEAPTMRPADGLYFVGWDKAFTNVTSDLVVMAKYERISYRIDYENTKGIINTNCLGFTIDDLPLTVGSLADTRDRKFKGWQPFATIPRGTTSNVMLCAEWTDRNWLMVCYELGDHLCRIGDGALVQTIEFGTSPTLPTIRVDEGYDWAWSAPKTNGTEVVIRGYATAKEYTLQIGGSETKVNYGVKKTVTAPFDQITENGTNIICVGWVGSNNVPASGVETQVTFTVTGDGEIEWNYQTNFLMRVLSSDGGSVVVAAGTGKRCATNEFWTARGSRYFLSPVPEEGFVFCGWLLDGETFSTDSDCEICVTAAACIRAVFEKVKVDCEVKFVLGSHLTRTGGGALTQQVAYGQAAIEPTVRADAGHLFSGWDRDFTCVTNNLTVNSVVSTRKYTVRFVLDEHLTRTGGGALSQQVEHGRAATAPEVEVDEGYDFVEWDRDFSQVTADMTVNGSSKSRWSSTVELTRGVAMNPIVLDLDTIFGARASEVTSVSVTKLPRGLSYDNATQTISGTPTVSGVTTATIKGMISPTESLTESMTFIIRVFSEGIVVTTCDIARGKTAGSGVYSSGKQVTLRATASRGYVFKGWYDAAARCVSQASSYAFTMPSSDVVLEAVFITTAEDAASVCVSVNRCVLEVDTIIATNIWTGLYLEWPLVATTDSPVSVKVSGLPSGLKFATKEVVDRSSGRTVPANTIYGTPTAGGNTSKVQVMVTTAGKTKVIRTMQVTTDALPAALVGTYVGGATGEPIGSASVTLAKTGKISGKWISEGRTWSMSASGLSAYYPATGNFTAQVTLKCGKDTETLDLMFGLDESGFGVVESELFSATFVNWKSEPLKTLAGLLKGGQFTVVLDHGVLSGKVGTAGTVTVTGAFDLADGNTYKARAKGCLVPIGDDMFELFVYYPLAVTKGFNGYAATLVLTWNGSDFDVTEVR